MDAFRFEVKIPIPMTQAQRFQVWLKTHPLLFSTHYAPRNVNSLYLDSCDLAMYETNLNGISQRKKNRIRWYGSLDEANRAKLEFKLKKSGKGRKITFDAPLDLQQEDTSWRSVLRDCYNQLPEEARVILGNGVMPVLICSYSREYYVSACQKIRATIDSNIVVYDQRYSDRPNLIKPQSLGQYYLLELKAAGDFEEELSELMGTCPMIASRHSKYVTGIRKLIWK